MVAIKGKKMEGTMQLEEEVFVKPSIIMWYEFTSSYSRPFIVHVDE